MDGPEEFDDPDNEAFVLIFEKFHSFIDFLMNFQSQLNFQLIRQVIHKEIKVTHLFVMIVVDGPY
jgi:hypothetical protein